GGDAPPSSQPPRWSVHQAPPLPRSDHGKPPGFEPAPAGEPRPVRVRPAVVAGVLCSTALLAWARLPVPAATPAALPTASTPTTAPGAAPTLGRTLWLRD